MRWSVGAKSRSYAASVRFDHVVLLYLVIETKQKIKAELRLRRAWAGKITTICSGARP